MQQHAARRLHWDFRLEHDGVLWSWAVPKGPSMDPADKRLAVRTEDHPREYADFSGTIPEGQYGAGQVDIWDRGTWAPVGDPAEGLARGELKFDLAGGRLAGRFVLVRMKPRRGERGENWLLIKERDAVPPPPAEVRAGLPRAQKPQLATSADAPPEGEGWLCELKFDGYRLLAFKDADAVRLLTRNGHDWTRRLPSLARAVARLDAATLLLDGELVALRGDGVSSFADLQTALSDGRDADLFFYAFDLLHHDGRDLRPCALSDRKAALRTLAAWEGMLRYSDHVAGRAAEMRGRACDLGLEGIVCKRADSPYRAGRGRDWLKVKCGGREEFAVVGVTPPAGSRKGFGALHLAYRDPGGGWQYAGAVGSGFTDRDLAALARRLATRAAPAPPEGMAYAGEPIDALVRWLRPDLVAEVQFAGWSGTGRLRHAVYLGLRDDKAGADVARPVADPAAERMTVGAARAAPRIVQAARPGRGKAASMEIGGTTITHGDRELWPGVTKADLARYWLAVAASALPEIAARPLALVRCPDGIGGERFFQKHAGRGFPAAIAEGAADGAPYLRIEDAGGLLACAQMAAIEVHGWGSRLPDALHPERLVFDLDPGEDVAFAEVVAAAKEVRARLDAAGLGAFCRTTGGKGLHVVVPLVPAADWETVRPWCREFAERMAADAPGRYVARLPKAERRGHILIDWLRNGLGATAVASFSPRARPGATVATPLAWREVTARLDPAKYTVATVPGRLARLKADPWDGFEAARRRLPDRSM